MKVISGIAFFLCLMVINRTEARVFNVGNDTFAVYVKGALDNSEFENTLVTESSGAGSTVQADIPRKLSGELGVFFANAILNFRLGVEYLRPNDLENQSGLRSSNEENLYSLDSEISVIIPKVTVEGNLERWQTGRYFIAGSFGQATLVARNEYSFTTAGSTLYGLNSFHEDLTATGNLIEGSLGLETLLADTTTMVFEAGYRSLLFESAELRTGTTNFQGTLNSGQSVKTSAGKNRTLDLSGIFLGFTFRFYL